MQIHSRSNALRQYLLDNGYEPLANLIAASARFHIGSLEVLPPMKLQRSDLNKMPSDRTFVEFESKEHGTYAVFHTNEGGRQMIYSLLKPKGGDFWIHLDKVLYSDHLAFIGAVLAAFYRVLECVNVEVEDVAPPAKLQRARAARGKLPLLSYKVLKLKLPNLRRKSDDGGGTHASPGLHLCRGHVHTSRNGNKYWEREHLAGNPHRLILKDYAVR